MKIDFVELCNFRRLEKIRIDFSEETTLFVGANNSGKTSAINALRSFLTHQNDFSSYDIPIALWEHIKEIGEAFEKKEELPYKWHEILPSLDVWLNISENEIHHVAHLIPTLDWTPENGLGVRLQLEPKEPEELLESYLIAKDAACKTLKAKRDQEDKEKEDKEKEDKKVEEKEEDTQEKGQEKDDEKVEGEKVDEAKSCKKFALWPENFMDYLKKRMSSLTVKAYLLDPSKKAVPVKGVAQPQELPDGTEALEDKPFKGLIKINEIQAHRGLSDYSGSGDEEESGESAKGHKQILTSQLRSYYGRHLDPDKAPEPSDITALEAIHNAQEIFDERLRDRFDAPLKELEDLGYPGVANPRLTISTQLKPVEGLNHASAVQYDLTSGQGKSRHHLPEQCNGLGYQNLISMVFKLISYRDDWMKVGKAALTDEEVSEQVSPAPLHLVLIEEPEAHLHVQVQQVFIRKAYDVLRNHKQLKNNELLSTQLVVSTHSSHIAHEVDFAHMRYFRRHPAIKDGEIPYSTVVNLSEVFGTGDETAKFVSRYLQATHSDLFFADGAIMVEGAAERMLTPHFIRSKYKTLHSCYVTLLEVGGSHAHRLKPLIEHLGLNTLIITDIDAVDGTDGKKTTPKLDDGQKTSNNVLKSWHPKEDNYDNLIKLSEEKKECAYEDFFSIRVAYQTPLDVTIKESPAKAYPATFEDALVLDNIDYFKDAKGTGLIKKFKKAIEDSNDINELQDKLLKDLKDGSKAGFALDMLYSEDPASIKVPTYIDNGLKWLEEKLLKRQQEIKFTQSEPENEKAEE